MREIISLVPELVEQNNKIVSYFEEEYGKYDNLVIYGAGYYSVYLTVLGNKIVAYCDSDIKKHNTDYCGYKVISPEELRENYRSSVVIISVADPNSVKDIRKALLDFDFPSENIIEFNHALCHGQTDFNHRQYFDVFPFDSNTEEIFVDAGCYDFEDSLKFLSWCGGKYKKIIAFEPNPIQHSICVEKSRSVCNVTVLPYGCYNEEREIGFDNSGNLNGSCARFVETSNLNLMQKVVRLDDILNGEKATFIKMDVEGCELNALKGAEQTILRHRPKLAVCVYHKPEDIWEIPSYILSLHSDYRFYLRHYSPIMSETVLYAVCSNDE